MLRVLWHGIHSRAGINLPLVDIFALTTTQLPANLHPHALHPLDLPPAVAAFPAKQLSTSKMLAEI